MAEIRRAQESLSPRRWQIGLDRLIAKQLIDDQLNPLWGPQHLYAVTPLGSNAIVMFAAVAAVRDAVSQCPTGAITVLERD